MKEHKSKIFLAGDRGNTENEHFRSYTSFRFGNYQHEHKEPFGSLYLLNDETLAGNMEISYRLEEASTVILLPVVGAIQYRDSLDNESIIAAGEAQVFATPEGTQFFIANPFETELVNYIQIWIKNPYSNITKPQRAGFDLEERKNELISIFTPVQAPGIRVAIGQFMGREEAEYELQSDQNGVYVFVLEGAFEVHNCLLEARDGLAAWEAASIEMEALSNNALVVCIEVPL
jgi:redox-sensitive bicupin YhaK (pirin superfamily)